ncbi:MAG TPA: carboxypeptidase-like regulatory domain-containing protein [Candidatus Thermoplasmatota archaeon]|nr:carboxypeptidase-like regulatory domain-containing protein [Candidatus Thermoplasmatota archaeon]
MDQKPLIGVSILAVVLLVMGSSIPVFAYSTNEHRKQLIKQDSDAEELLQIPYMIVHVKEIYGTVDEPQYRPLANVTVRVRDSLFGIFWEYTWSGTTGESGSTPIIWITNSIKYWVTILKDGYHTYGCSSSKIIFALDQWTIDVDFTMAEDGSPFIKQINQLPHNSLILHQIAMRLFIINEDNP